MQMSYTILPKGAKKPSLDDGMVALSWLAFTKSASQLTCF